LTGPAGLLLWESDDLSYEQLKEKLRRRYGSREQQEKFRVELRYRKRKQNETVHELAQDVERLISLAYPTAGPSVRDVLGRDAFIDALNDPELEFKVREKEPTDLYSALTLTMKLEVLSKAREVQRESSKPKFSRVTQVSEPQSCGSTQPYQEAPRSKQRFQQNNMRADSGYDQLRRNGTAPAQAKQTPQQANEIQELRDQIQSLTQELSRTKAMMQPYSYQQRGSAPTGQQPQAMYPEPLMSLPTPQNVYGPALSSAPVCYACGQSGHIRRNCPNTTSSSHQPNATDQTAAHSSYVRGTSRPGNGAREASLEVRIGQRKYLSLLDTGSEITLIPACVAKRLAIRPTRQRLLAANGTEIPILGEASIRAYVGTELVDITGLVSEHVCDIMLGIDWLQDNEVVWNFATGKIVLHGQNVNLLYKKTNGTWCRRVVLAEDVVVPARSEIDLPTSLMCQRIDTKTQDTAVAWATLPKEFVDGLLVARTALPNRATNLPVRIINVTDKPARVDKGTIVTELEALTPLMCDAVEASAPDDDKEQIITEMLSRVDESVPESARDSLHDLLLRYSNVFSKNELDLGWTDVVTHSIDTGDNRPFRQQLRRYPPAHLEAIDKHLHDMQRQGVIEPARSPWASNIVLAKKKDGSLRCCIDYRQLNGVTRKDAYLLPHTDACLDAMSNNHWYSTFDMRNSYHQVAMSPDDADKTAFITRRGMFRFRTMPFGLCNAGATFQRLMDLLLSGLNLDICLVYLDDIIVYSTTLEQHLDRLDQVLDRLQRANLKLKPSKCSLLQTQVVFLGHVVSGAGIATDPEKIRLIANWPAHKTFVNCEDSWALPVTTVGLWKATRISHIRSTP